jgi:hypothetical protein
VICFSQLFCARVIAASAVELDDLFFFEGGRDAQLPHRTSPKIKNSFDNSGVRYIYSVIRLKNKRWKESAQDLVINVRYLRADGGLIGEPDISQHIPADWEYATLWTGWGWDIAGKWEAGAYGVELWLDNTEKIGEGVFHLESSAKSVAGSRIVSSPVGVRFDQMGFFEGSAESTEKAPDDWSDERLKNTFRKSEARYIFTLVSLKNRLWQKQEQDVSINIRYYHADGRLFDVAVINYTIPAEWEHAELWNGSGWPEPGNWETGRYRIELWLNDNQKIGESHFTVH